MTSKNTKSQYFCLKGVSLYHKSLFVSGSGKKAFAMGKGMHIKSFICSLEEGFVGWTDWKLGKVRFYLSMLKQIIPC